MAHWPMPRKRFPDKYPYLMREQRCQIEQVALFWTQHVDLNNSDLVSPSGVPKPAVTCLEQLICVYKAHHDMNDKYIP